jgi:catechol 2,3-dioxygenase-like lactoylglutathione lyase family enzyme
MTAFSEIRMASISVADLDAAVHFYQQCFHFAVLGSGEGSAAFLRAWQTPPGLAARYVVLGREGAHTGLLRLVEFSQRGEPIWDDEMRRGDHGFRALNFRVADLSVAWPSLLAAGAVPCAEPTWWEVTTELRARDSQCLDPSHVLLDVFETRGREDVFPRLDAGTCDLETVAVQVANAERATRFYAALGFEPLFDRTIVDMPQFFRLPAGTVLRDINMIQRGRTHVGRIELVELAGRAGVSLRERARPPNLGIFGISIETQSLGAAESRIRDHGLELIAGPLVTLTPPFGRVHSFTCYGPDGEMLAFFQRFD